VNAAVQENVLDHDLVDSIAVNALARGLAHQTKRDVDGALIKLAIRSLWVLPKEQRDRIIQREFDGALRDITAKTRREEESERYRRRARRERGPK
jgi:hypothetical protein